MEFHNHNYSKSFSHKVPHHIIHLVFVLGEIEPNVRKDDFAWATESSHWHAMSPSWKGGLVVEYLLVVIETNIREIGLSSQ